MADIYRDIRTFLDQERELFGESVLTTSPARLLADSLPAVPQPATEPEELSLFELSETSRKSHPMESWTTTTSLGALDSAINQCLKCPLGQTRTRFVFGVGNPNATLMLIGEAPGADEDLQGEPFVGRAGQLLNKILEAIQFKREDVYICNILKCRPPGNRKPQSNEVEQCIPYLKKQIALVKPRLILCLGLTAAENLLHTSESLGNLRGRVMRFEGTPLMVTYHPAALLRNPNWKRPAWEDVQAARALHDKLVAEVS